MTSESVLSHRLAAILAADAQGYSRLMAQDDSATVVALDAARVVFRGHIESHGGRIIDMAGDSVLAVFETATGAVQAALAVQEDLKRIAGGVEANRRMPFRIGIHLGDIIVKPDGSVYGDGVNVAARLQTLAEPGGITVSNAVRGAARSKLEARFADQGEQQVKNIPDPVRAYRVYGPGSGAGAGTAGVAGAGLRRMPRRWLAALAVAAAIGLAAFGATRWGPALLAGQGRKVPAYSEQDRRMTFAVMPVTAPADDKQAIAFASALTDAVIDQHTTSPWSRVISRGGAEDAAKKHTSARDVGRALDVHFVVRGTVVRSADKFATSFTVTDTRTELTLGTKQFMWPPGKVVSRHSSEVDAVVDYWLDRGAQVELAVIKAKSPQDMDVRDLTLLAAITWKQDKPSYDKVVPLLQRALADAPDDRAALRLSAKVNLCECVASWSADPKEQQRIGAQAVERGLELFPGDVSMLVLKLALYEAGNRYEDALVAVDRLLVNAPDDADYLSDKARVLLKLGRPRDALVLVDAAQRESNGNLRRQRALAAAIHFALGTDEQAVQLARSAGVDYGKSQIARPRIGGFLLTQAAAEARLGRIDRARDVLATFREAVPEATTLTAIRRWVDPRWELAGYQPLYDALRLAGVPE